MITYEQDIAKVLTKFKEGAITLEEAVRDAVISFSKEIDNPSDKPIEVRMEEFKQRMVPFAHLYPADMLEKFYNYFTGRKSSRSKKMLFEVQKTWNMGLRLKTWKENNIRFKRNRTINALNNKLKGDL